MVFICEFSLLPRGVVGKVPFDVPGTLRGLGPKARFSLVIRNQAQCRQGPQRRAGPSKAFPQPRRHEIRTWCLDLGAPPRALNPPPSPADPQHLRRERREFQRDPLPCQELAQESLDPVPTEGGTSETSRRDDR